MAASRFLRAARATALAASIVAVQGCATRAAHQRHQPPAFASAAPTASTQSWASIMPAPGVEQSALAYARRDADLGLPPPGSTSVAGAWRDENRPSIHSYHLIPLSRSHHTFLFFTAPAQHERRAPRVPYGAHPWRTAW